ncbi:MAG: hypothetical protein V4850_04580 [Myxococcota bacterium]
MTPLLLLLACTLGPHALDEWKAEVWTDSRIRHDPDFDRPDIAKGRGGRVLVLTADWGKLPIITDTQEYLNVVIALPRELDAGTSFSAANRSGFLRMGGMSVGYESREIEGTIHVVEVTAEGVVFDLDLVARSPVIDRHARGEKRVKGRVSTVFRAGPVY